MSQEIHLSEPDPFMGLSGPLVWVYEIIAHKYEQEIMTDGDWMRAASLCEFGTAMPTLEHMFQTIQQERRICLNYIDNLLLLQTSLPKFIPNSAWIRKP